MLTRWECRWGQWGTRWTFNRRLLGNADQAGLGTFNSRNIGQSGLPVCALANASGVVAQRALAYRQAHWAYLTCLLSFER